MHMLNFVFDDLLEADMKREIERREQERKRSPKVDFMSAGIQPPIVIPAPRINPQLPGNSDIHCVIIQY